MIWLKLVAGIAATVLAAYETWEGRTVGDMQPNRLVTILFLIAIAFM